MRVIDGQLTAAGMRIAVVAPRFNSFIVEQLLSGAVDAFTRHGGSKNDITVVHIPGSFELGLTCKKLAESNKFDAVVALGAVIRGATSHYDLVCSQAASGVAQAALSSGVPVIFGVITTDSIEQAVERSGTKAGNKGADAVVAAIEMVSVTRQLEKLEV